MVLFDRSGAKASFLTVLAEVDIGIERLDRGQVSVEALEGMDGTERHCVVESPGRGCAAKY